MMTHIGVEVFGGVDTHSRTHHAAVIDGQGKHLGDRQFPATAAGYRQLLAWLTRHGPIQKVGVEGTGAYGAELARKLSAAGLTVIEVDRPDRKTRRSKGKSDPIDAYAAAQAMLSGRATGRPKTRDGIVEAIRVLRVARRSAVKARTQSINQLHQLLTTATDPLRESMRGLTTGQLVITCTRLRPTGDLAEPHTATKLALRVLARRYQTLSAEISELDHQLAQLTARAAPTLTAVYGAGPDTVGQLLVTAGDNPQRMHSEAAFARLCAAAPIPASSGRTNRHRLDRGGDRHANHALHTITLVRMCHDPRTRAYVQRRTSQGLSKKDIIRCLKRHIAREIYKTLIHDLGASNVNHNT